MNEFDQLNNDDLKYVIKSLKSYKQGCEDTYNLIKDQHERTMVFYNGKIELAEQIFMERKSND